MDIILYIIIGFQFAYILYKDVSFAKERERLQLKLMSKDIFEYKGAVENKVEEGKSVEDPYIAPEEASLEQILKAKEK